MKLLIQCILTLVCLFYFSSAKAQIDTLESEKKFFKHEIGYIIPFGIIYRYHFKKGAIRCVLNYKNSIPGINYGPTLRTKLGYQSSLINKKIKLFAGVDFVYVCSRDRYQGGAFYSDSFNNMSVGLSPFLGSSYQFKKRFSLGIEVASGFFYTWYSDIPQGYNNYLQTHLYNAAYLYSISLNISYHF